MQARIAFGLRHTPTPTHTHPQQAAGKETFPRPPAVKFQNGAYYILPYAMRCIGWALPHLGSMAAAVATLLHTSRPD